MLKTLWKPLAVVLVLGAALCGWYAWWSPWNKSSTKKSEPVIVVNDFDAFQRNLATRVSQQFGIDAGSVVVAPAAYDIGWLLDPVQTYPADQTDCIPKPRPVALDASHLFPSYQLSSDVAATITLGSDALQQVTSASLNAAHQASLVYSIDHVQVLLMDLKTVEELSHSGACGAYIAAHPKTRLIHGLVLGKISFRFSTSNPASIEAKLPKFGTISAKGNPNDSTVTVSDDQPTQILEIVSVLQPTDGGHTAATNQPSVPLPGHLEAIIHPASGTALPVPGGPGHSTVLPAGAAHVYLQQDLAAPPNSGAATAAALQRAWPEARVEQRVERVPSAKMTATPQVRFFRASDQGLAEACRDRLKSATGLDARVVRVGLTAPAGQLEVWLQKSDALTP